VKLIKWYGWLGLVIMAVSTVMVALGSAWFARWYTPYMWTGYIMLADAIVLRLRGRSLITGNPREFILLLWLSVLCWLAFEVYNFRLKNWYYVNLPANMVERNFGYLWAFATIFPGIFESADLLEALGAFKRQDSKPKRRWGDFWLSTSIVVGLAFIVIPPMLPPVPTRYTFGFVWLGFFFLLDPVNYRLGAPSLLRSWEEGRRRKLYLLLAGGAVCGLLWESWNFYTLQFSGAAWIYSLPYPLSLLENVFRIGRMPVLGFLGFPPFALECWAMWHLLKTFLLPDEFKSEYQAIPTHAIATGTD
jgi:hypothetical protein